MKILTQSSVKDFHTCPRMYKYRYVRGLVPLMRSEALYFGAAVHDALEAWHGRYNDPPEVQDSILAAFGDTSDDSILHERKLRTLAIINGYTCRYQQEDFEVVVLEKTIIGKIKGPGAQRASRNVRFCGKIDGLIKIDGEYWLMEHKTASRIDAAYLERIWTDFQIHIYAAILEKYYGIKLAGVLYNILAKCGIKFKKGETIQEYEIRLDALRKKNKYGTSNAVRRMPETDEQFMSRLAAFHALPESYHREMILLDHARQSAALENIAETWRLIRDSIRRSNFIQHNNSCANHYGKTCPYFPICRANGSPLVIDNEFKKEAPYQELNLQNGEIK